MKLVHGLFAHPSALSEHAGADPIRTRKLQHRHVGHAKLGEAGGVQFVDDSTVNRLGRHPQQGSDEHVVRRRRRVRG